MNKLKQITVGLFLFTVAFTSCQSNKSKVSSEEVVVEKTLVAETAALSVDELLAEASKLVGQEVEVEGFCTHICAHGGGKIFLMGSDDTKTIRIEAGKLGRFSQDCVNNVVVVTGTVAETRIDEAYLARWEEQAKAQTAEKHGEDEGGCSTEKKARGESGNTTESRIASFRERIAAEKAKTGKDYLAFYHVVADSYEIEE